MFVPKVAHDVLFEPKQIKFVRFRVNRTDTQTYITKNLDSKGTLKDTSELGIPGLEINPKGWTTDKGVVTLAEEEFGVFVTYRFPRPRVLRRNAVIFKLHPIDCQTIDINPDLHHSRQGSEERRGEGKGKQSKRKRKTWPKAGNLNLNLNALKSDVDTEPPVEQTLLNDMERDLAHDDSYFETNIDQQFYE